jgi:putative flippase GtrA
MERKENIFDRVMRLPLLRVFYPFYERHREALLYLFFGVLTTAVSWGSFYLFYYPLPLGELTATALSWVAAVTFAFFTNRTFVFRAHGRIAREALSFLLSRLSTLLVEEGYIFLFVTLLAFEAMWVKIAGNVLILVLNYLFSKFFVFKK